MTSLSKLSLFAAAISLPLMAGVRRPVDFVPPGTQIQVQTDGPINVARWDRGRVYPGHVTADVFATDGRLALPRGSYCEMIVRQVSPGQLALDLESITAHGRRYVMDATGPQFNMNQAQYNNGAGIVGNIIGALSGRNVQYQGDHIHVPGGTVLTFQLQQPLHVVEWGDEGYYQNGEHYHPDENHGWYR
jgi:hypothetical protein